VLCPSSFFTVKISSTKIDQLLLFVYTSCPALAKTGEINYLQTQLLAFLQTYTITDVLAEQPGIDNNCVHKMEEDPLIILLGSELDSIQSYKRISTSKSSTAPMNLYYMLQPTVFYCCIE